MADRDAADGSLESAFGAPGLTMRDLGEDDADVVAALHATSWLASYRGVLRDDYLDGPMAQDRRSYWSEKLSAPPAGAVVIGVFDDDVLIAFGAAWPDPSLIHGAYMAALHVSPDRRGAGLGRRLFATIARRMAAIGMRELWLLVFERNRGAIRLYEALGASRGLTKRTEEFGGLTADRSYFWTDLEALAERAENGARAVSAAGAPSPPALTASEASKVVGANHPVASAERAQGREKQRLGDVFGLDQYGVNRVTIGPGVWSTVRHWHSHEDEFVYVLSGEFTLVTDRGETVLRPGDCAGFKAGVADGHRLENRSDAPAVYLEIGSRRPDVDEVSYSDEDLMIRFDADSQRWFMRRDGTRLKPAD